MNDCGVRYCCYCHKRFAPHPRLGQQQRTCGGADCQKQRWRANTRTWRTRHPEADDAVCRKARRPERQAYRAYRRHYWATHPEARRHHAAYMRQWRARHKSPAPTRVRDASRDIQPKLLGVNTYLQVIGVREANRVITAKLLSPHDLMTAACT